LARSIVLAARLGGYAILGGLHFGLHPERATWVRDFIQANRTLL